MVMEGFLSNEVGLHMVEFLCVHLNFSQTRAVVIVFIAVECLRHYSNVKSIKVILGQNYMHFLCHLDIKLFL